jgi:hypothetical protein
VDPPPEHASSNEGEPISKSLQMTPFDEMIKLLEGMGYSLSCVFKVFRDRNLALSEADGVFVRSDIVV